MTHYAHACNASIGITGICQQDSQRIGSSHLLHDCSLVLMLIVPAACVAACKWQQAKLRAKSVPSTGPPELQRGYSMVRGM